jgi:antitoxin component of MazEF toxin-antitoxin module
MVFLGSARMDSSKRITLVKEVADILQLTEKDHVNFYIQDGEIIIRKVLEDSRDWKNVKDVEFWEWARKSQIEIDLMENEIEKEQAQSNLDFSIQKMREIEESRAQLIKDWKMERKNDNA